MDGEIEIEVQELLNELINQVDGMLSGANEECNIIPNVLIHPYSPPTDLSNEHAEMTQTTSNANLEFFSDIFDIMPSQFCASQRESPLRKRTPFLAPLPPPPAAAPIFSPTRDDRMEFVGSPTRSQWYPSQDLFKSSPPTPRSQWGMKTPEKRSAGTVSTIVAPKSNQCMTPKAIPTMSQNLIMVSPSGLTQKNCMIWPTVARGASLLSNAIPPSPGTDLVDRLNSLLPKKKRVNESGISGAVFKAPYDPVIPSSFYGDSYTGNRNFLKLPAMPTKNDNHAATTRYESKDQMDKSKPSTTQDFCPPYHVGAYSTAPLSSHSSRKIRVGLSRRGKRATPFAEKDPWEE